MAPATETARSRTMSHAVVKQVSIYKTSKAIV